MRPLVNDVRDVHKYFRTQLAGENAINAATGMCLALICRIPVVLGGAAGSAKSLAFRVFSKLMPNADIGEIQLTNDTSKDEVIGVVSAKAYEHLDRPRRNVHNGIFKNHLVLLDEIEKAGKRVRDAMLSPLSNERIVLDDGESFDTNTELVVCTRNEEFDELAFADRMSINIFYPAKTNRNYLAQRAALRHTMGDDAPQIITPELLAEWRARKDALKAQFFADYEAMNSNNPNSTTKSVFDLYFDFIDEMVKAQVNEAYISDRTQERMFDLMAAFAVIHNLPRITLSCLWACTYVFPNEQDNEIAQNAIKSMFGAVKVNTKSQFPYPFSDSIAMSAKDAATSAKLDHTKAKVGL